MDNKRFVKVNSKIGLIFIGGTQYSITHIMWEEPKYSEITSHDLGYDILDLCKREILEYLDGRLKKFSVPIDPTGTSFQESVWQELLKIPYGTTISYKDLANRISNPRAMQAVGSANGKNPISIIIPCHRVIAVNGNLSGYAGGVDKKERLLRMEGSLI